MSRDWLLVRGICLLFVGVVGIGGSIAAAASSEMAAYMLGFLTGAMLFCLYGPQLLGDEPTNEYAYGNAMGLGVSFILWGPLLSFAACVSYGGACAVFCTVFFWGLTRSWVIRLAPVTSYALALGVYALMRVRMGGEFSLVVLTTDTTLIAVLWNVLMFAQMAWARYLRLPDERRRLAGLCQFCGYDMSGIAERDRCPECGRKPAT